MSNPSKDTFRFTALQKALRTACHPTTDDGSRANAFRAITKLDPELAFLSMLDPGYRTSRTTDEWYARVTRLALERDEAQAEIVLLKKEIEKKPKTELERDEAQAEIARLKRELKGKTKTELERDEAKAEIARLKRELKGKTKTELERDEAQAEIARLKKEKSRQQPPPTWVGGLPIPVDQLSTISTIENRRGTMPKTEAVSAALRSVIAAEGRISNRLEWAEKLDVSEATIQRAEQHEIGFQDGFQEGFQKGLQEQPQSQDHAKPQSFPVQHTQILFARFGNEYWQVIGWNHLRQEIKSLLSEKYPETVQKWFKEKRKSASARDTFVEISTASAETGIPFEIILEYEHRETIRTTGSANGAFAFPPAFPGYTIRLTKTDDIALLLEKSQLTGFEPPAEADDSYNNSNG